MSQFDVYRNPNPAAAIPLLLDVQSDLLTGLATRVVVPLRLLSGMDGTLAKDLMPVFEIDGIPSVMLTPQIAGVHTKQLGAKVAWLGHQRSGIIAALDMLITGI